MPIEQSGRQSHPGKQGRERIVATEKDLETIQQLAADGKSLKVIAVRVGVSMSTLDGWLGNVKSIKDREDPRVREAWELGLADYEDKIDSAMHHVALNTKHKSFAAMNIWAQKVKLGRSEKRLTELEVKEEGAARLGSLFSPTIEIVETHRDPKTGETLQDPTVTPADKGQ